MEAGSFFSADLELPRRVVVIGYKRGPALPLSLPPSRAEGKEQPTEEKGRANYKGGARLRRGSPNFPFPAASKELKPASERRSLAYEAGPSPAFRPPAHRLGYQGSRAYSSMAPGL